MRSSVPRADETADCSGAEAVERFVFVVMELALPCRGSSVSMASQRRLWR